MLSGDLARGVGIGNAESDTSPGDGGGLLPKSICPMRGLREIAAEVFRGGCLSVLEALPLLNRLTELDFASRSLDPILELVLVCKFGLAEFSEDVVAAEIIAMAAAAAGDDCAAGDALRAVPFTGEKVLSAGVADSLGVDGAEICSSKFSCKLCCNRSKAALASACFFLNASSSNTEIGRSFRDARALFLELFLTFFFSPFFSDLGTGVAELIGVSVKATLLDEVFVDRVRPFLSLEEDLDELDWSLEGFRVSGCTFFRSVKASTLLLVGLVAGNIAKSRVITPGSGS